MTRRITPLIILLILSWSNLNAQLLTPSATELYRDDVIPRIDILIDQTSLDFILDPSNRSSNELFPATFIFNNGSVNDTLENVGFRLRGNTSRGADKKSFKIDINSLVPGREYYGVRKINLNGQHNDPTSSRAKICSDIGAKLNIPYMRTNHVAFYINGSYRGLYSNVEQIDQEFVKLRFDNKNGNLYKCLYPADLDYMGMDPDNYKEVIFGRRKYDLKSNEPADNYLDIANFISILNLTSDNELPCELESVFNVDQYLRTIVFDILTGNWDGPIYNQNNFYLYHNEETNLFEYIPFDLDNTMGIDWVNRDWGTRNIYAWSQTNNWRPIYTRIIENKEYRDRFSYYMQEALLQVYNEAELYPYLDDLRDRLEGFIAIDEFHALDYGFSLQDFIDGFDFELPYLQTYYGIKPFIQTRLISAFDQLVVNDIHPIITNRKHTYANENEKLHISATIKDDVQLQSVEICYYFNNGNVNCLPMKDDGTQDDGEANDGRYGVIIPEFNQSGQFNYTISAVDNSNQLSFSPRCKNGKIFIEEASLSLAINEIMASNSTTVSDEEGEFEDWIEIYNYGNTPIFLGDKYLSDDASKPRGWKMPFITIQPGEYLLFWADDDRNQGAFHSNFKLNKGGEFIGIFDDDLSGNALIDGYEFSEQTTDLSNGRLPNGIGDFSSLVPTPGSANLLTDVDDIGNEDIILIYPNPTSSRITLEFSNSKPKEVEVYDSFQRLVTKHKINGALLEINLPNLPGIYFIKLVSNDRLSSIHKVIKI